MPVFFALAAACFFAGVGIAAKRGVQHNSLVTAMVVSLPVGALVMLVFALFDLPESVSLGGVGLFVAAGFIGEGVGRTSFILAVQRIGPSTATPIQTATYPVFALVGGVLLFSETVTPLRIVGAMAIVAGIWALVGQGRSASAGAADRTAGSGRWVYLVPVVSGLAFAGSDIVRKLGLVEIPFAAFGALVGNVTIVVVWGLVLAFVPRVRSLAKPGPGWQWFLLAGVLAGLGVLSVFRALGSGDVSVVGPIIMAQPLAVVMLSALFLRDLERLTWKIVLGAVLTVLGVILITISG
ncbi:MAG: EamA family transporter [bacterium]|nr:EamA family transporter [bacterium]MDE0289383.1 EamA family transporter [bacterium]MDE0439453.1 EamA family transporter [bacterium]